MSEDAQSARAGEIQSCQLQEPTSLPAKFLWGLPGWPLLCTPAHSYTKCTLPLSWWEHFHQEGHDDPYLPVWGSSLSAAEWSCHGPPISAEWGHSQIPGMTGHDDFSAGGSDGVPKWLWIMIQAPCLIYEAKTCCSCSASLNANPEDKMALGIGLTLQYLENALGYVGSMAIQWLGTDRVALISGSGWDWVSHATMVVEDQRLLILFYFLDFLALMLERLRKHSIMHYR